MTGRPRSGNYGIAEWYGRLYRGLGNQERLALLENEHRDCPYLAAAPDLAPKSGSRCSKKGGVCSIRNFQEDGNFGTIAATCPNRFFEDKLVLKTVGKLLLGTDKPHIAKEIPFLVRDSNKKSTEYDIPDNAKTEDVGRIDLVCVAPGSSPLLWCAVEMQAVYFSGKEMGADFRNIRNHTGNGIPATGGGRRPDFRSSGPKRLMPQLQIKVPTLRRWGKKMVVVVDEPFFGALGEMDHVSHVSNADIVWVVVRYKEVEDSQSAKIEIANIINTTLECAVDGLTAGYPTSLPEFEAKLLAKLPKPRTA
jgi:Restriction endonuclease NotI